jgi:PAS domain S-box-containing protein
MQNAGELAELFLEQGPDCQWLVRAGFLFERIYGDAVPLFGKTRAELTGQSCEDVLDREQSAIWTGRFARALEGELLALHERRGETTWYVSVFPIRVEGAIRYAGGIAREITASQSAERELRQTVLGALKAQEFERATMARFLHDSVGQNLTALGLQLDLIRMDLEAASTDALERVGEVQKRLDEVMEGVREYSYELNPATAERAGLRPALDRYAGRIQERFAGVVRVNVDPSLKIEPKLAGAFYQIAHEAVKNAVQHAICSSIEIAVKSTRTGIILEVRDNGRGFDPGDLLQGRRGLGLLSMEHYAAEAGLELSIVSTRERGTTVRTGASYAPEK